MSTLLVIPFASLIIAQCIKLGIYASQGKFSWKDFDSYGGMPSSHAAFLGSALAESAQLHGISSSVFAIIAFLTFIVLRDAVGIRRTIGKHAEMINNLVIDLPDYQETKYPHLEPRQGHTYGQLAVGLILGAIIALVF